MDNGTAFSWMVIGGFIALVFVGVFSVVVPLVVRVLSGREKRCPWAACDGRLSPGPLTGNGTKDGSERVYISERCPKCSRSVIWDDAANGFERWDDDAPRTNGAAK
jgi:hypothetical protein